MSNMRAKYWFRCLLIGVCLLIAFQSSRVSAQSSDSSAGTQIYIPIAINADLQTAAMPARSQGSQMPVIKLLVDTDPGVDDAIALAWILSQDRQPVDVLGVVSVAGNASLANTTNNVLTVLEKLERQDVPVVMGAGQPLSRSLSMSSLFIHGPDGLWFLGFQNPHDLSRLPADAPSFYCSTVAANPGATLLALGPLTNVANAIQQCAGTMRSLASLVVLGGARQGGNRTPLAEFNFWQDPEAAEIVLASGLPVTLVPLDTFSRSHLRQQDLDKLLRQGNLTVQFLAPAIQRYAGVQISSLGSATIPDAVAAVVALDSSVGVRQSALVRVVLDSALARGQTMIALSLSERIAVLANDNDWADLATQTFFTPDPNFNLDAALAAILWRASDNALISLAVADDLLTKTVMPDLRAR